MMGAPVWSARGQVVGTCKGAAGQISGRLCQLCRSKKTVHAPVATYFHEAGRLQHLIQVGLRERILKRPKTCHFGDQRLLHGPGAGLPRALYNPDTTARLQKTQALPHRQTFIHHMVQHIKKQNAVETLILKRHLFQRRLVESNVGWRRMAVMKSQGRAPLLGDDNQISRRLQRVNPKSQHQQNLSHPARSAADFKHPAPGPHRHHLQNIEQVKHQPEILWVPTVRVIGLRVQPHHITRLQLGDIRLRCRDRTLVGHGVGAQKALWPGLLGVCPILPGHSCDQRHALGRIQNTFFLKRSPHHPTDDGSYGRNREPPEFIASGARANQCRLVSVAPM